MSKAKILLIEDSPSDIQLLRLGLDRTGEDYDLEVLQDGGEALRFLKEYKARLDTLEPCVILVDLYLPKHDGIEILRALKLHADLNQIQMVILSSSASPAEEAEIRRLGASYRTKPVTLTEYMDLGAEILAICRGEEPAPVA
jgi:CheY-like chemotaxis protein